MPIALPGIVAAQQQLLGVIPIILDQEDTLDIGQTTTFSLPVPSSAVQDDVLFFCIAGGDNQNSSPGITSDEGIQFIRQRNSNGILASMHSSVWAHQYDPGGGDPSSFGFTATNSRTWSATVLRLGLADPADIDDVNNAGISNSSSLNLGTITPTDVPRLSIHMLCIRSANADLGTVNSTPADMIEILNHRDATNSDNDGRFRIWVGHKPVTDPATSPSQIYSIGDIGPPTIHESSGIQTLINPI